MESFRGELTNISHHNNTTFYNFSTSGGPKTVLTNMILQYPVVVVGQTYDVYADASDWQGKQYLWLHSLTPVEKEKS